MRQGHLPLLPEVECGHAKSGSRALLEYGWLGAVTSFSPTSLTESDTLGIKSRNLCFNKLFRKFWCTLKVKNFEYGLAVFKLRSVHLQSPCSLCLCLLSK